MEPYTVGNRNMISHIKSDIEEILYGYAFEIADSVTISSIESEINEYLELLKERRYIRNYSVLPFPEIDNTDNNRSPFFNISIQTVPSCEYINLQCTIFPPEQYNSISKSKQKRLQIELDDELFQM